MRNDRESSRFLEDAKSGVIDFWNRNVCQADLPKTEKGTREFFDEIEEIRYWHHYHLPPLFERMKAACPEHGKLLEVGCGMGTDLLQLARMGLDVTGVDLTESGIRLAERRFALCGSEADLCVADAENLPFDDESFDVVYSFGVLHHTPDTEKAVGETHRVLRKGGTAFIMLYHRLSLNYLAHLITGIPFDGSRKDRCPVERAYTKKEIRRLFGIYDRLDISIDYLFGTGWGIVNRITPKFLHRPLGSVLGWHAMIEASREI